MRPSPITRWNSRWCGRQMRRTGCDRATAAKAVKRQHPACWQSMTFASNKGHDVALTEDYLLGLRRRR